MDKNDKTTLIAFFGGFMILFIISVPVIISEKGHDIRDWFTKQRISSLYEDFQDACSEHNWEEAHKIVKKLEVQDSKLPWGSNEYVKACKTVVLQESLSIIEEHGVNGLVRIVGLIKEYDADWVYRELLDVAIKIGDKELATRLSEMCKY
jgi:hypothetical protein